MAQKYVSEVLKFEPSIESVNFYRADINFYEIDHTEASYEGRVFINNPHADETTPTTSEHGYAGSFYIFGHGGCFGDIGHCEARPGIRPYDTRPKSPTTPKDISITVTDVFKKAAKKGNAFTVTVVPIVASTNEELNLKTPLKFKNFDISLYEDPSV